MSESPDEQGDLCLILREGFLEGRVGTFSEEGLQQWGRAGYAVLGPGDRCQGKGHSQGKGLEWESNLTRKLCLALSWPLGDKAHRPGRIPEMKEGLGDGQESICSWNRPLKFKELPRIPGAPEA